MLTLNIGAHVASTEAEGPGRRYALWLQGCPLRCPGCCNPHLLEDRPNQLRPVAQVIAEICATPDIEGITLLGGEPFHQAAACAVLCTALRAAGLSVMVFSGFTLAQLQARPAWAAFLAQIDLLVDGPYVAALHQTDRRWIGSTNQRIHFLTDRYAALATAGWDAGRNTIELRLSGGALQINGFPHADIDALVRASLERLP